MVYELTIDQLVAGIDIGATKTRVAVYYPSREGYTLIGDVKTFATSNSPESNNSQVKEHIRQITDLGLVKKPHGRKKIKAVGIGAPGVVLKQNELVRFGDKLSRMHHSWEGYNIAPKFRDVSDVVYVDSDSIAGAIGHSDILGLKKEDFPAVYFSMGTGLGVALLYKNQGRVVPYRPKGKLASEWGHLYHEGLKSGFTTFLCRFDNTECLETFFSGSYIKNRYGKGLRQLNEKEREELAQELVKGLVRVLRESEYIGHPAKTFMIGGGAAQKLGADFVDRISKIAETELGVADERIIQVDYSKIVKAFDPRGPTLGAAMLADRASNYNGLRLIK